MVQLMQEMLELKQMLPSDANRCEKCMQSQYKCNTGNKCNAASPGNAANEGISLDVAFDAADSAAGDAARDAAGDAAGDAADDAAGNAADDVPGDARDAAFAADIARHVQ